MRLTLPILILLCATCCALGAAHPMDAADPAVQKSMDYIRSCQQADGGFAEPGRETNPGTSWFAVMAIVASGGDPHAWTVNGTSAVDYWKDSDEAARPEGTAELGKMVTLIAAAGEDPRAFGGHDHLADLKGRMKPDGQFGDFVYTTYWGLFGLAAAGENAQKPAAWLKKQQNEDGGYGWMPGAESDSDDTAAVIMALIAAGEPKDSPAVALALDYLRTHQMDDGGFNYGGSSSSNAASAAWVVQAATAAGENPSGWSKNGKDAASYLQNLQQPDGSFAWTAYTTDNPCGITARAVPALLGKSYPILPGQKAPALSAPVATATTTAVATPIAQTTTAAASSSWQSVTVTDDFGEMVVITHEPRRIVSLAPANTEILFALGLGDRVVGVTDYCNYPAGAEEKPKVGGYSTVNIERVVAAKPDLVLAAFGNTEEVVNHLRDLGLTVVALNPDSMQGTLRDITLAGEATGRTAEAADLKTSMQTRIDAVTAAVGTTTERPSVMHAVWYDPIWVSGNATFQNELITLVGGKNAFPDVEGWQIVTLERFITTNPDIILVNSGTGMGESGNDLIYRYFMNEPRFAKMKAVQDDRVYIVSSDIIDRGGPRIVDALEEVAAAIHPELFPDAAAAAPTTAAPAPGFGAGAGMIALFGACILLRRRG
ncbi:MAG: helical backbone metal receptor [Methanofollis sp.]|uniref:helical backbone metal receptor n=1 Tax=Methanofollis sp. TaxID=2052835 RepID=UPI00261031BE|nr:helical backbone metal receptor [Methanofollis sp.]MDD4255945.1 helical backbone metal receptor [Methanofollis sp.]